MQAVRYRVEGEITKLKQHLTVGYADVTACKKCQQAIQQLKHCYDFRDCRKKNSETQEENDHLATEPPSYYFRNLHNCEASKPNNKGVA